MSYLMFLINKVFSAGPFCGTKIRHCWCLYLGEDLDEFKAHMLAHIVKPKPPKSSRITIPKTAVKNAFNCAACSKNFAYQRTLHRHMNNYCTLNCTSAQRPKSTSKTGRKIGRPKTLTNIVLRCANCALTFLKKANLVQHQKNFCRIALLRCDQCSYRTSFAEDLRKHISIHLAGEQLKCKHFGCDYSTLWTQHLRKHHQSCKIRVPAPETLDGISRAIDMLMEEIKIVEGESEYSCSFCSFKSKLISRLKEHLKVHVGRKPVRCPRKPCKYETKWAQTLRSHIRRVHPRKAPKTTLQAALQTEENLGSHMEYEIKTEGTVEIHNESQDPLENSTPEESKLTFDNNNCNSNNPVTVQNSKVLKVHGTQLRCDKCSFTTLRANNLRSNKHWKHTSMKPFKCPNLGCAFMTRWAKGLREHQRSCSNQVQIPAEISDQGAIGKIKTEQTTEALVEVLKTIDEETPANETTKNPPKVIMAIQPRRLNRLSIPPSAPPKKSQEYFTCSYPDCSYKSNWEENVGRHECGHNPRGLDCNIPCQVCPQKFLYLVSFLHHMTSKHSNKLFCPWCLFLGDNFDEFKSHILAHILKESSPEFRCVACSKTFARKNGLLQHQKFVHAVNVSATSAKKIEACNDSQNSSIRRAHPRKVPKAPLQTEDNLGLHMECEIKTEVSVEIHNDSQDPLENVTPEESRSTLDNNNRSGNNLVTVQNEKSIKVKGTLLRCDKCSFTTLYSKSLRRHGRIHTSEKGFKCQNFSCTFTTRWAHSLKNHLRSCRNQIQIPAENSDQADIGKIKTEETTKALVEKVKATDGENLLENPKPEENELILDTNYCNSNKPITVPNEKVQRKLFACYKCSFTTSSASNLGAHSWKHTSMKPFKCPNLGCNFMTRWPRSLRPHQRSCPNQLQNLAENNQTEENLGSDRECKDKIEGFVSSSTIAFACMLCEFTGDSKLSALKHSCKHRTVVISLNRIVPNAETILGL